MSIQYIQSRQVLGELLMQLLLESARHDLGAKNFLWHHHQAHSQLHTTGMCSAWLCKCVSRQAEGDGAFTWVPTKYTLKNS